MAKRGLHLLSIKSVTSALNFPYNPPLDPPYLILQNLNSIDWSSPGGPRGIILRTGANLWDGRLYYNPAFTGGSGSAMWGSDYGPLGILSTLSGSAAYRFGTGTGVELGGGPNLNSVSLVYVSYFNGSGLQSGLQLGMSPQVSGFLAGTGWVGYPTNPVGPGTPNDNPRNIVFFLNAQASDIPGQAQFQSDFVK